MMSSENAPHFCECGEFVNHEELAAARKEIERLKEALRHTLKIWDAFILCPICAGADGNHGMACNVPKLKALAEKEGEGQ